MFFKWNFKLFSLILKEWRLSPPSKKLYASSSFAVIFLVSSSIKIGILCFSISSTFSECSSHTSPYFFSLRAFSISVIARIFSSSLLIYFNFSRYSSIFSRLILDKFAIFYLTLFTRLWIKSLSSIFVMPKLFFPASFIDAPIW